MLDVALYAVGDVQGCMASFSRLLDAIAFDPARDRLWLVGDLVNRGPQSLDVLRWARHHDASIVAVLGNHDVHLLGRAAGTASEKKRDTLDDVLRAPDRDELIDWLRARPLIHAEDGFVLVHAGLHPRWSIASGASHRQSRQGPHPHALRSDGDAVALAAEVEAALRAPTWRIAMAQLAGSAPAWSPDLAGSARLRSILSYLVRVRTIHGDGSIEGEFDGPIDEIPKGTRPWFAAPSPAWRDHVPVFGHWSRLGLDLAHGHIALDTGCVWGRQLTAIRLPDRALFQIDSVM
jgi:bis(5'-nucleosyl)-tetraphosphatase (symmetrical)